MQFRENLKPRPLVNNATDKDEIARSEDLAYLREKRERDDWCWLLSNKIGRRVIWKILSDTKVFHVSFGEGNDRTNFNEGRRAEGLKILNKVQTYVPEAFSLMMKEAKDDNQNEE